MTREAYDSMRVAEEKQMEAIKEELEQHQAKMNAKQPMAPNPPP